MRHTWFAIVALVVISLLGDFLCRSMASSVDRDKLLKAAGDRINRLPTRIGHWRMAKSEPLDDDAIRMLRCTTHENRVYVDDQTGEVVSVILMAGIPGPLIAHTPEICYSSLDFEIIESAHPETIRGAGDRGDVLNEVTFRSRDVAVEKQRVFYGWRKVQGPWLAPSNPRLSLGGEPMLYKLQLAAKVPMELPQDQSASDTARRFLVDLLPALETSLRIP